MENPNRSDPPSPGNGTATIETRLERLSSQLERLTDDLERLNAHCDQKFDEIATMADEIGSRINNLR
jgi:flagellar capping protein FliD